MISSLNDFNLLKLKTVSYFVVTSVLILVLIIVVIVIGVATHDLATPLCPKSCVTGSYYYVPITRDLATPYFRNVCGTKFVSHQNVITQCSTRQKVMFLGLKSMKAGL
jgi:hypothetical protein